MPKFYCEYCGIYLTHSSPSGRKQHAEGRKHIQNKIDYYTKLMLQCQRETALTEAQIKKKRIKKQLLRDRKLIRPVLRAKCERKRDQKNRYINPTCIRTRKPNQIKRG